MLQPNFFNSLIDCIWRCLKGNKGIASACKVLPNLAQFSFRRRCYEFLKVPESLRGVMVEVLLTENTLRSVFRDRKGLPRIRLVLGECPRRLPHRLPLLATGVGEQVLGKHR